MADISIFEPREMIAVLKQIKAPSTFLLDTFFPTSIQHRADTIDIDVVDGTGRKLAPYVSPMSEGKVMKHKGFTTNTIKPPYIKILTTTEAGEAMSRQAGETIYDVADSPAQRASRVLGEDLKEAKDQIYRRLEWNAAQLMDDGAVVLAGDGVSVSCDFLMPSANKEALTGTDVWNNAASDPIKDIENWAIAQGQLSGKFPTDVFLGVTAAAAFRKNTAVLSYLDVRRMTIGTMAPSMKADGLMFIMRIESVGVDVWSYVEQYSHPDTGVATYFVPEKKCWLATRGAYTRRHFGLIKDLKAGNAAVNIFAKTWEEENPSAMFLLVQSAPVVALHQSSAFGSHQVLT